MYGIPAEVESTSRTERCTKVMLAIAVLNSGAKPREPSDQVPQTPDLFIPSRDLRAVASIDRYWVFRADKSHVSIRSELTIILYKLIEDTIQQFDKISCLLWC